MNLILQIVIPSLVAFFAVNWSYFKILKIAKIKKIVDTPDARKLQRAPVPILGGIAVFFGMVAALLVAAAIQPWLHAAPVEGIMPVICAAILMLYIGAMDDMVGVSALNRLVIETLTILGVVFATGYCVDNFDGMWGVEQISWYLAVPISVIGGVGIINSINMIDGVNGLSSGLCITCCILMGAAFIVSGDILNAMLAFVVIAALLPFFFHNVFGNRSRMFIGDAGTMMMGVILTWFVFVLVNADTALWERALGHKVNLIAMVLAILSVPVFDTLRVIILRISRGGSPFRPDKTHLHHIFIRLGVSHLITTIVEILLDIIIVVGWVLLVCSGVPLEWQLYWIIALSLFVVWGTYFWLHWHEEHHTERMHRLARLSTKTHISETRWWKRLEHFLDGPVAAHDTEDKEPSKPVLPVEAFYHFNTIDTDDLKEQDRKKVYDYMRGKSEVYIDDVKKHSGANIFRVDAIVTEGILDGFITIVKEGVWGAPMIVSFKEDH